MSEGTSDKGSRRNKGAVRTVAFFDVLLSLFLMGFYFIGGVCLNTIVFQAVKGPFPKYALIIISLIMWVGVFGITYLQLSVAYRLFLVTFQHDALGPETAAKKCLAWLRTSTVIFGFIMFKVIYCYLRFPAPLWYIWLITTIEVSSRLFGIYYVREFRDDLKHHIRIVSNHAPVAVKYSNDVSVPAVVISNHIEDV